MTVTKTASQGIDLFFRLVLFGLILPLLFIAGVQLFVLSGQTETYFAWTFAGPFSPAFLGAGYWAAMVYTFWGTRAIRWEYVRTSIPAALTAVLMLTITTFLHLERFHLDSPLFITRFVTWVWIVVYVVAPLILVIAWILLRRSSAAPAEEEHPLPAWMRRGYQLLALFALACGITLFLMPAIIAPVWPWAVMALAARSVGSWLSAFGVACVSLAFENDLRRGAATSASLFAFCILQMIVVARYVSAVDWGKPMAFAYIAFLVAGAIVTGANVLRNKSLSR